MDLFPTTLALAGIKLPGDRPIDGRDITSLLVSDAPSPHEAIFSMRGDQLATVRAGKWKLHLIPPGPKVEKRFRPDEPWVDKRRPDGVRLIAPFDQAHPSQFPGSMDGPPAAAGLLFDLVADPAEQDDRAREFPEIVQELRQHARDFQARAVP
jgi:arylsulfatase A-like enzyme